MLRERTTNRTTALIAVLLIAGMGCARAQTDTDVAAVMAANNAYYAALSTLDAAAMEKVWAREAYIANVGPFSKTVQIGSAVVQDGFKSFIPNVE